MRSCPACGAIVDVLFCPHDRAPTLKIAGCTSGQILPGSVLDRRYLIHDVIGTGGCGLVLAASDGLDDRPVAVKVLRKIDAVSRGETVARFIREVAATADLVCPHTVAMLEYGITEGGELFAVMERLEGESLSERLRRFRARGRPLPTSEVVKVAASVLKSLAEAHGHGLVHRDIKPGNIVFHRIGKDEVIKVIDFGMVRVDGSRLTSLGSALGTPAYMSPEQAAARQLDRRSDLYSLGCVMYHCVAQRPPFHGLSSPLDVMQAHVRTPPTSIVRLVPEIERDMAVVIHTALAKDPRDRYRDAEEMLAAVRAVKVRAPMLRANASLTGPKLPKRRADPRRKATQAFRKQGFKATRPDERRKTTAQVVRPAPPDLGTMRRLEEEATEPIPDELLPDVAAVDTSAPTAAATQEEVKRAVDEARAVLRRRRQGSGD